MAKKSRKRRSKKLVGAARSSAAAPKACRVQLSSCMRGKASKAKSSRCMKAFHACKKRK